MRERERVAKVRALYTHGEGFKQSIQFSVIFLFISLNPTTNGWLAWLFVPFTDIGRFNPLDGLCGKSKFL